MTHDQTAQSRMAGHFDEGSTCPCCQNTIDYSQMIVVCGRCNSVHHDTCWSREGGCSSYHCDTRTHREVCGAPEMIITAAETARVTPPAPRQPRSAEEVASEYLPPKPNRLSITSLSALVIAGIGVAATVGGLMMGVTWILISGIAAGLIALVTGAVGMMIINSRPRVHGRRWAVSAMATSMSVIVVCAFALTSYVDGARGAGPVGFNLGREMPTDEELDTMAEPLSRALRANVVVTADHRMESSYGAGVVIGMREGTVFIITNKHVIGDSPRRIGVLFYNGESSQATVEWRAPGQVDIAILSCTVLAGEKIEAPEMLDGMVARGQKVFAIGNPMRLAWTYSDGAISSIREQNAGGQNIMIYQTQTPINTGNSGGGLYDEQGRLAGINTWTQDKSVAEGISFSIASKSILALLGAERSRFLPVPGGSEQ